jgi:hypothetical protein
MTNLMSISAIVIALSAAAAPRVANEAPAMFACSAN